MLIAVFGPISVIFVHTMEVNENQNILQNILCSTEEGKSYRFGTTWKLVNNDRIFIFGWTIPLMPRIGASKLDLLK